MKYFIEIIKKNKLLVGIYLSLGILLSFLNNFNANYFINNLINENLYFKDLYATNLKM